MFIDAIDANLSVGRMPALSALSYALKQFTGSEKPIIRAFGGLYRKLSVGEDCKEAFLSEISGVKHIDKAMRLRLTNLFDGPDLGMSLSAVRTELAHANSVKTEIEFGSMQRHLAMGMLVSTVLPSMLLFGFVGYSILYGSEFSALTFLIVLVVVFPGALNVISGRLDDAYG